MHINDRSRWVAALGLTVLLLLVMGGGGCGGTTTTTTATETTAAPTTTVATTTTTAPAEGTFDAGPDGVITIGASRAATGPFAFFDVSGLNGVKLAVDKVNAEGGIGGNKIVIVDKDTKSDPAVAGQVAEELLTGGAEILLVPDDMDMGIAAAQAGQKAGVLTIAPSASSVLFGPAVGNLFFNGGTNTDDLGNAGAVFLQKQGWDGEYSVTNNDFNFFQAQTEVFKAKAGATDLGSSIMKSGQTDFAPIISDIRKLKDKFPDVKNPVIWGSMYFPDIATFIKQLRDAGIDYPVLGNFTWSSQDLPKIIGPDRVSNIYFLTGAYYEGADASPEMKEFVASYQKAYGRYPENSQAVGAYWTMFAVFDAIKQAGSLDGAALSAAMYGQKDLKVPGRTIARWTDGHQYGTVDVVGFDDQGNYRLVETFTP